MTIAELCVRNVAVVNECSTLSKAIDIMSVYNTDNVVVIDGKNLSGFPVGILTDQDIVQRAMLKGFSADQVQVKDVMTRNIVACSEDDGIYETISLMQKNSVKHVPVLDEDGRLAGIISAADLIGILSEELISLSKKTHLNRTSHRGA